MLNQGRAFLPTLLPLVVLLLALLLLNVACGTNDESGGTLQPPATAVVERWRPFGAGEQGCLLGGDFHEQGLDANGDGMLTDDEVDPEKTVVRCTVEREETLPADDATCPLGGFVLQRGPDVDADQLLDEDEIDAEQSLYRCILEDRTSFDADAVCSLGGEVIQRGLDADGSGALEGEERELEQRTVLCTVERKTELPTDDATCPLGGLRRERGLDVDGSGTLDEEEIDTEQTEVRCVLAREDPFAADTESACPLGGLYLFSGLDADGSETLDDSEIDAQATITRCLIAYSSPLEEGSEDCPFGGSRHDVGLDRDGNQRLEESERDPTLVTYTCRLEPGTLRRQGALITDTEVCPFGGRYVEQGVDGQNVDGSDGDPADGVLQDAEVVDPQALTLCNPAADTVRIHFEAQNRDILEDATAGSEAHPALQAFQSGEQSITFHAVEASTAPFAVSEVGVLSLKAGVTLDHETVPVQVFDVIARAESAEDVVALVSVIVGDVKEITFAAAAQDLSVPEDAGSDGAQNAVVGTLVASTDRTDELPITFALAADELRFQVDAASGVLTLLLDAVTLDHETTPTLTVAVTASSEGAADVETAVPVAVTNVPDLTIAVAATPFEAVPEHSAAGTVVGTVPVTAIAGQGFAYVIESVQATLGDPPQEVALAAPLDPAAPLFQIAPDGELTVDGTRLDYESADRYALTVLITANPDGSSVRAELEVLVADLLSGQSSAEPYAVATLASLQSIATGFSNAFVKENCTDSALVPDCSGESLSAAASLNKHYRLSADIDAHATAQETYDSALGRLLTDDELTNDEGSADLGNGFLPIGHCVPRGEYGCDGTGSTLFRGSFDGAGYAIRGLSTRRAAQAMGLFATLGPEAQVRGVTLLQGRVVVLPPASRVYLGLLAGFNAGQIEDSFAFGHVLGVPDEESKAFPLMLAGGLVGVNAASGMITHSAALAFVDGDGAREGIGGLLGTSQGYLRSSFAAGQTRADQHAAGLVGYVPSSLDEAVSGSFAAGFVRGGQNSGGLVGAIAGPSAGIWISRNLASSQVDHWLMRPAGGLGGLVGNTVNVRIQHGVATGRVEGLTKVGGVIGATAAAGGGMYSTYSAQASDRITCSLGEIDVVGGGTEPCPAQGFAGALNSSFEIQQSYAVTEQRNTTDEEIFQIVTEDELRALDCVSAIFQDANSARCSAANEERFPYHFGAADELPVINEAALGGVLSPAAQRLFIAFARAHEAEHDPNHAAYDAERIIIAESGQGGLVLEAPAAALQDVLQAETNTLSYFWILPPRASSAELHEARVEFSAPPWRAPNTDEVDEDDPMTPEDETLRPEEYVITLTVLEHDGTNREGRAAFHADVVGVYTANFPLLVNPPAPAE